MKRVAKAACWARNISVTYGGRTPLEIAFGRKPPDVLCIENMLPQQLVEQPDAKQQASDVLQKEALKAHLESRQRMDLRRDLARKLRPSDGPFDPGQSIWYWERDMTKLRGGEWLAARVVAVKKPPMIEIDLRGKTIQVNQSKIRKNPDK